MVNRVDARPGVISIVGIRRQHTHCLTVGFEPMLRVSGGVCVYMQKISLLYSS